MRMTDSIYQFVLTALHNAKGSWPTVARCSGVSLRTIEKIARREIKNPGVSHIERLARYFRDQPA
jgi:transcriptional regulator with XRE-family HTH domain